MGSGAEWIRKRRLILIQEILELAKRISAKSKKDIRIIGVRNNDEQITW